MKNKILKIMLVPLLALGVGLSLPQPSMTSSVQSTVALAAKKQAKHQSQRVKKQAAASSSQSDEQLAQLDYQGTQTISVNNGQPTFSNEDLDTSHGAWQQYGNLDRLNRATQANALLNRSLMPKAKREPLTVDPTGWHNKKIKGGYLYNRSHLIGYQLTGQNNNWKNLITGTRSLNDPEMVRYEDEVADYLRANPNDYVRYQVTPVFRGDELLARGVHMQAQSVNSQAVSFNVYIFNVQDGVTLNYADGTSMVDSNAQAASSAPAVVSKVSDTTAEQGSNDQATVYVTPNGTKYHLNRNCRALSCSKTVKTMTQGQAIADGYTLCGFER